MKKLFGTTLLLAILIVIGKAFIIKWSAEDFSSLLVNLLTECLSVLVTVFIIDNIMKKRELAERKRLDQMEKDEYKRILSGVLGNRLRTLFTEISGIYLNFVLKEPATLSVDIDLKDYQVAIIKLLNELDSHVVAGFRSKPITCYIVNPEKISVPDEQIIKYQQFCEFIFKNQIQSQIDKFIQRYISILTDDMKISIYTIENSIANFIFVTPLQHGHEAPMPTTIEDIDILKSEFKKIGGSLLDI
ncbi:hypothetical protein, partial [Paenibacillus odorifer]